MTRVKLLKQARSECRSRQEAHTLMELLAVVVILAVVAGVAIPKYFIQAEKARIAEAMIMSQVLRDAEKRYLAERQI